MNTGASRGSDDATDQESQRLAEYCAACHINELPRKLKRHRITHRCCRV